MQTGVQDTASPEDALRLKISGYLGIRQSPVNKTDEAGSRLTHLITHSMDTKVHRRVDGYDAQASTLPCSSSNRQNNHSAKTNLPSATFEMATVPVLQSPTSSQVMMPITSWIQW